MNIQDLVSISNTNRTLDLERLAKGSPVTGDFESSVTGHWTGLGSRGEGLVSYNNKEYVTKPLGFVSLPAGTEVEMTFASGIYYSKF